MASADFVAPLEEADRASAPAETAPVAATLPITLPDGLAEAPHRFSFHEVMRWLEAKYASQPRFGRSLRPAQDVVRLGQEPDVTHAPAALARIEPGQDGRRDRLLVHMFGLFGPDGPLPLYLTEMARERQRNHSDAALRRFLDLFHHRLLSLLHRAWADVRPTLSYDRPNEDLFGVWIGALIGLSTPGLRNRDAMPRTRHRRRRDFLRPKEAGSRQADRSAAAVYQAPPWPRLPVSCRRAGCAPSSCSVLFTGWQRHGAI